MMDIEKIAQRLQRLWAQVQANEALLLKHAKRHDAGTAADPLTITSSAHARLHALQSAADHSGTFSSTQHGTIASGDLHTEYQKESEKNAASGYVGLTAGSKIAASQIQEVLAYADLTDDPIATHAALDTGVHGAGASTLATEGDITTHTAVASAHHVRYADSEARAAVPFNIDIPFGSESQTFYP